MENFRVLFIIAGFAIAAALGVGIYTFIYAKGYSYLTGSSEACVNCHIMREQYDGWVKSSHRHAAGCNDCHAPHDLIGKYKIKAINGFMHSYAFTTGFFHEPIRIKQFNRDVTEGACRSCHANVTHAIEAVAKTEEQKTQCTSCHQSVGHLH